MVFHLAEPWGIGPLRWQGIVYRMGPKFARELADARGKVLRDYRRQGPLERRVAGVQDLLGERRQTVRRAEILGVIVHCPQASIPGD